MKWYNILGVVVGIMALIQFLNWFFKIVGVKDNSLSFLFSTIYAILIVIILIQYQNLTDITKIKSLLNTK